MNRTQITQAAKDFLTEYKGDSASATPFAWALLVTQAANDVARRAECFYTSESLDIASGTSDYLQGSVFGIRRLTCADGTGNTPVLTTMATRELNLWGVVNGYTQADGTYTVGPPQIYTFLAANKIRLLPVPNYAVTGGLVIEGLGYPSDTWDDATDDCPLPIDAHLSVVYRAAMLRVAQFPDDENKARAGQIESVYETEIESAKNRMAGDPNSPSFTGAI